MNETGHSVVEPADDDATQAAGASPDEPSAILTICAVGLALGTCAGLGIVIGSRWPNALEHYSYPSVVTVIVRLAMAGVAVALVAAGVVRLGAAVLRRARPRAIDLR